MNGEVILTSKVKDQGRNVNIIFVSHIFVKNKQGYNIPAMF